MEKIQSAIAKARATREGRLSEVAGAEAAGARPTTAVGVPDLVTEAAPAAARAAAPAPAAAPVATPAAAPAPAAAPSPEAEATPWKALPTFKADQALMRRNRIVAFEGGHEAATFDVMRTRLLQQMRANKWRRLAITSPSAGCGKTTTSLNLAFSLARQSDQRMLLAEVDLRRPALARMLGLRAHHSFAQVLEGRAALADNAVRYGNNLAIATNHDPYRNPAELLHGPTVGPALAAIEARFEPSVMIFDMPPLLVGDDALAFIGHVDCVLLVAAAEKTTIEEVDTCERDLAAHTNVLGVILNKCRFPDRRYGYSHYA
jgi:Mrp family chromosome partitioning ATPase